MYMGIDLTSSERRASGYAFLDEAGALREVGLAHTDEELVALAESRRARLVAIDAPLSLPKGLCCLEERCPCQAPDPWRQAEREMFRLGIGIYAITKQSIIWRLVERAMPLRRALEGKDLSVIEVYPYACKLRLFGKPLPRKSSPTGRAWLRARLEGLIEGVRQAPPLNHDQLDALVAAYTAYLHGRGLTEAMGDAAEGAIILPAALV